MSNEKKNLQQNPSRYFRVMTAVLFLADVVLAPWLREGDRSFSVRVFIQSVKAAGGIEKFALTETGNGSTLGIANLTMSYWCIYLIIGLGAVLLLRAVWLLAGRKGRILSGIAYALGLLYLCAFMVFNYYGYSGGMIVGMLLVFLDAMVGKYLDELSPAAELCGAVNTIVNDNGHLTGHITDGIGFMSALKDNDIDVIGKKMTIVGAGGAATAIEIQAALDGVAEITIFNRKDEFWDRAVSTVEKINTRTSSHAILYDLAELDKLKEEMDDSYLFVNATGVGMKPLEGQSVVPDKSYFRPELIVVDVPYSPLETKMRSMAKEVGCKTMNGLGMMLFQGSAAFELWTGEPMPIEHMKEVLNIKYD